MTVRHLHAVPDPPRPGDVLLERVGGLALTVVLLAGLAAAGTAVGYGLYDGDNLLLVAGVCGAIGWSAVALWLLVFDPPPGR